MTLLRSHMLKWAWQLRIEKPSLYHSSANEASDLSDSRFASSALEQTTHPPTSLTYPSKA